MGEVPFTERSIETACLTGAYFRPSANLALSANHNSGICDAHLGSHRFAQFADDNDRAIYKLCMSRQEFERNLELAFSSNEITSGNFTEMLRITL